MTTLTKTKPRLTLQRLLEERKPIWVSNLTGTPDCWPGKPGNIILQFGQGLNITPFTVPPGGEPFCLSDEIDYESIKNCTDLFKNLRRQVLKLHDPEEAEVYYTDNPERLKANREKIDRLINEHKDDPVDNKIGSKNVQISNRILDTCLKLRHGAVEERAALESLFEHVSEFGIDDFSYLFANGKYKSIKKWAKQQMTKLSREDLGIEGASEDDDEEE